MDNALCAAKTTTSSCCSSSLPPFATLTPAASFSKVTDSSSTEIYLEDVFGDDGDPMVDLRKYLYPGSEDEVIIDLSNASSVQEVFDILETISEGEWKGEHTAQAMATLFHIKKIEQAGLNTCQMYKGNESNRDF